MASPSLARSPAMHEGFHLRDWKVIMMMMMIMINDHHDGDYDDDDHGNDYDDANDTDYDQ